MKSTEIDQIKTKTTTTLTTIYSEDTANKNRKDKGKAETVT